MATKREMADNTVFFSVLGHKKFIHKILAKSESVRFQPLFKFFWCSQRIALKVLTYKYKLDHIKFLDIHSEVYLLMLNILVSPGHRMCILKTD